MKCFTFNEFILPSSIHKIHAVSTTKDLTDYLANIITGLLHLTSYSFEFYLK